MNTIENLRVEDPDFLSRDEVIALHGRLKSIVARRGQLDAEEAKLLRIVEQGKAWKLFACVNQLDYMERVLGYLPHTGSERMRVARRLAGLPQLEAALADGSLPSTAIRELTRVAVTGTEVAWRDAAVGKNLRQIEELVAGREQGDLPTDPPKPDVRPRNLTFVVGPEAMALARKVRTVLSDESGRRLDDDSFVEALCLAVLEQKVPAEPRTRAKYDLAVTVCAQCDHAKVEGGGVKFDIDDITLERMRCDARNIGIVDTNEPQRASQTIPPAVYRQVWIRDGGRCRVPGCRSARGIEAHHRKYKCHGGDHDPDNILLLCSSCHFNIHLGSLILEGPIDNLRAIRPGLIWKAEQQREAGHRLASMRRPRGTSKARPARAPVEPLPLH